MNALNPNTSNYLLNELRPLVEGLESFETIAPVSGGDINEAFCITTNTGSLFLKKNSASRFPAMFQKEARGLKILAAPGVIRVPEIIWYGKLEDEAFLVLEFIESGSRGATFSEQFGNELAALHHESNDHFGLDHDNYIGCLHQSNAHHSEWASFFVGERLEPLFSKAYDAGHFHQSDRRLMDRLFERVDELFPKEPPALVHGDLWGGNYLVDKEGSPVIIDPAVYYGHREMDIAMMHLFGGFDRAVFEHYDQARPLEAGWQQRVKLCNIYPLLVHVNLFGGGYAAQVMSNLKTFS